MARRFVILLLPALLAFGACGDDSKDSGSGATTTAAGSEPAGGGEDDQKLADSVVLKLADFPSGWTEDEATPEEEESADPFETCMGAEAKALEANTSAEAESADFSRGETTTASSIASVEKTEANAEEAMDLFASQKLKDCLNRALADEIKATAGTEEGVTIGDVALKVASFPNVADETLALQFSIPISGEGIEIAVYADLVFFREGRTIAGLFLTNIQEPFPSGEGQALAKKMAARMKAA